MSPDRDLAETISKLNECGTVYSRNLAEKIKIEFEQVRKDQEASRIELNYRINTVKQNELTNSGLIQDHSKKIDAFCKHNQDAAENTAKSLAAANKTEFWFKTNVVIVGSLFLSIALTVIVGYMTVVNKSVENLSNQNKLFSMLEENTNKTNQLINELKQRVK
jgi:hypothetical protein